MYYIIVILSIFLFFEGRIWKLEKFTYLLMVELGDWMFYFGLDGS
jgi:hypothetical protein